MSDLNENSAPRGERARIERRAARRRPAADYPAEMGWEADGTLRLTSAMLMDISATGSLVLADDMPEEARVVVLRLRWPVRSEWITAALVAGHRTRLGPYLLRVSFQSPPSRHFLATAMAAPAGRN